MQALDQVLEPTSVLDRLSDEDELLVGEAGGDELAADLSTPVVVRPMPPARVFVTAAVVLASALEEAGLQAPWHREAGLARQADELLPEAIKAFGARLR